MNAKFPNILCLVLEKYWDTLRPLLWKDQQQNPDIDGTWTVTHDPQDLNRMFDPTMHVLITFHPEKRDGWSDYVAEFDRRLPGRIKRRWLNLVVSDFDDMKSLNYKLNFCYMSCAIDRETYRPGFSMFTTCFKSYKKILRAYESIKIQKYVDWEWVIMDDSPDDDHFAFLKQNFGHDARIRIYRRSCNCKSIGTVKNEAIGLCRGSYILEMDHDDEILPNMLLDAVNAFESDPLIGFVYMDFCNINENGTNFNYGNFFGKGYAGYFTQKYTDARGKTQWVYVEATPNINNVTISHLVCLPNHPRIWRKTTLQALGSYSELLPICDDQEILLRTAIACATHHADPGAAPFPTKIAKVCKLAYVQYMNEGSNNFSWILNREINKLGPNYMTPQVYSRDKVHELMRGIDAYDDESYVGHYREIWKRTDEHKFCNVRLTPDYDREICILNMDGLYKNFSEIRRIYDTDPRTDFLFLSNDPNTKIEQVWETLDTLHFDRFKCYVYGDCTIDQIRRFYHVVYAGVPMEQRTVYE